MTEQYHRVHPLTPALQTWSVIFALVLFATTTFSDTTFGLIRQLASHDIREVGEAAGIFLIVFGIAIAASSLWWRAISYTVTEDTVIYRWGLLSKKVRSAPLDRTQAIDVVQPFHARIFGLAAVRVETAGGLQSRVEIAYLRRREAEQLKEQLLGKEEVGVVLVPPIPVYRSLISSLLSKSAVATVILTFSAQLTDISLAALIPMFVGTVPNIWRTIDNAYQFTARQIGNTIVVSYGLANLQRKVLNIGRSHAIVVWQPVLWRPFGWWKVQVSVAGYGERFDGMTVLPVGSKETAMQLVKIIMGESRDPLEIPDQPDYRSPKRARWVSPIDWKRQAFLLDDTYAVEYRGRIGRTWAMTFRRHIQEIDIRTGPLQRLLKIATVKLHFVRGPVSMAGRDLKLEDAHELFTRLQEKIDYGASLAARHAAPKQALQMGHEDPSDGATEMAVQKDIRQESRTVGENCAVGSAETAPVEIAEIPSTSSTDSVET
ncbi:PH domain-containing protein [Corynebacterium sp. HS2168-gen11]|uniref:PH domain-containing protein n=1 Tax=Corynebacterium sp. HS2168-gen11 TaxID=2974027 RepID=UPI00216B3EE5|nr:PH domain-containing protein [Corynebacterium sp. HS2168-gen11]MCS4535901.1 PH domain-containing protein [Corynebacterium sp. HS2168-gen11]